MDEPIFILRGQDVLAVFAVDRWIELGLQAGVSVKKLEEARLVVLEMRAWGLSWVNILP